MTSPSLLAEPIVESTPILPGLPPRRPAFALPAILFAVTAFTTTAVGMRYMNNFHLGRPPLYSDADILPFEWALRHLKLLATGLPFSLTLIAILLAHEFGHYFACRAFNVRASLPYLLPAPSLSGSFGAVIRLRSRVRTRSALIVIGAMGPIAGFTVALVTITLGLRASHYAAHPLLHRVQSPLIITGLHRLLTPGLSIYNIVPHPILVASWMGILITALNLIPAGQLDGGHILYALSPRAHNISSKLVVAGLFALGIFFWVGWMLWGAILLMPSMRHPQVPDDAPVKAWHYALIPICFAILILAGTYQPFEGFSLYDVARKLPHRYGH